jgi:putative glycosyltransferase
MDLSIVTTLYHSAGHLEEFYRRMCRAAEQITDDFEIVFVNDGSPDHSLDVALALFERDPRVKVVDLSRNFSHHKAMMTGFLHARGELVFQIDCDLEEEPELLGRFYATMVESEADVVFGVRQKRKGGFLERIGGQVFWWLFNRLASCSIPANRICATLMSRRYVDSLVAHQEREVFLAGLQALNGFKQVSVVAETHWRGRSTYTLAKRVALFVNAITAFSSKPLVYIFYLGSAISLVATAAALYLIVRRLFFGAYLDGWPSLIVSIWLLGGLTIFSLGVIGIYLAKMFVEIKQRPYTIVRQIYDHSDPALAGSRTGGPRVVATGLLDNGVIPD